MALQILTNKFALKNNKHANKLSQIRKKGSDWGNLEKVKFIRNGRVNVSSKEYHAHQIQKEVGK